MLSNDYIEHIYLLKKDDLYIYLGCLSCLLINTVNQLTQLIYKHCKLTLSFTPSQCSSLNLHVQ